MSKGFWRRQKQIAKTVYDAKAIENELLRIFEQKTFGQSTSRLCIPSFEGTHGKPWIYKTPHHPDYNQDRVERMVVVGRATSAVPTYFKAVDNLGYRMVDGGLWANNPTMIALVDALAHFEIERRQVRILSLGCGADSFRVSDAHADGDEWQWRNAIREAIRAQSFYAMGKAYLLVGKDNVIELDAPESENLIAVDDTARAIAELPNMARALIEAGKHRISEMFLSDLVEQYRPLSFDS